MYMDMCMYMHMYIQSFLNSSRDGDYSICLASLFSTLKPSL